MTFGFGGRAARAITDRVGNATTMALCERQPHRGHRPGRPPPYVHLQHDGEVATVAEPRRSRRLLRLHGRRPHLGHRRGRRRRPPFGYGSDRQLTLVTDPRGHVATRNTYDNDHRVISQKDALDHETTWDYATDETTITDPSGKVTEEHFTDLLPTEIVSAAGTSAADDDQVRVRLVLQHGQEGRRRRADLELRLRHPGQPRQRDRSGAPDVYFIVRRPPSHHAVRQPERTHHDDDLLLQRNLWQVVARAPGRWPHAPVRTTTTTSTARSPGVHGGRFGLLPDHQYGYTDAEGNIVYSVDGRQATLSSATFDADGFVLTTTNPRGKTTTTVRNAYELPMTVTDPARQGHHLRLRRQRQRHRLTDRNGPRRVDGLRRPRPARPSSTVPTARSGGRPTPRPAGGDADRRRGQDVRPTPTTRSAPAAHDDRSAEPRPRPTATTTPAT